jgi:hypothetical protein
MVALGRFCPCETGCFVPMINVTGVCAEKPALGDMVWVTGWRPETGEPMRAQIPAALVPPSMESLSLVA